MEKERKERERRESYIRAMHKEDEIVRGKHITGRGKLYGGKNGEWVRRDAGWGRKE